ncbi:MAG: EAL domain-containing protein [Candidatus Manganitrophus sp.]|nr:MAG: EAL domain-containing protein [Candidatus Manganitrophus sp.]
MALPIQIHTLIVEDSEEDTELLLRELQKGGYDPIHERVETRESLQAALDNRRWDIIFSDYTMPQFKGTEALALLRERGNDTPFLFVSGTIGEDRAVAAMKAGADDYIIKGNLKRLIPAVNRELREAEVRRERKKAEEALQESNQTLEAVVQSSPLAIIVIDPAGNVRMWNPAAEQILGWSAREVLGRPIPIRPEETKKENRDREAEQEVKRFVNLERRYKRKDGVLIDTSISTSLLCNNNGEISGVMWIIADITERKRAEATIKQMAYYDTLTALPNRTLLHDRLQQAIPAAADENKSVGLLLLDLDRFREINDTLGHPRGDALLQQIGPRLHAVLQPSDTIARLGGDEFAVMLPRIDSEQAALAAGRLLKALEKPFLIEGIPIVIEASIGMALSPEHGENPDSLIQHADIAMYVAKENKKGVALYSRKVDKHSPRRLALLGELRDAIENNHLFLVYQPKIHLWTRRVIGVEALVRWQHPQYGVIPPDQFITIAERSGLIQPLTLWVVKTALAQCKIWQREGKAPNVAVNLSARNLEDPELPDQIARLLEASGVGSASLNLEITESALMVNPAQAMETLTRLNNMEIQLSIDDFGTGYSSLGYLKKLPVHQIKIDKSFVKEMATDEEDAIIVRSTIELTHNLGLKVVAEGVESEEVLEKLAALDCDAAQGYHISRPLPPSELNAWFTETAPAKGWNL